MRLRSLLPLLLAVCSLTSLFSLTGCEKSTPVEAAALRSAETDTTAYTLPPVKLAKAEALSRIGTTLHFGGEIWSVLQLLLLLQLGIAARMRNVANNLTKKRWAQCLIFVFQLLVILTLLNLPLKLYGHHLSVAYGFSVQHWGGWFLDQGKSFLLLFVFGGLGAMLVFYLVRKFPRRWWVPLWVSSMAFTFLGVFLAPLVFDPLFNHFQPLTQSNPALVVQLERVAARVGSVKIPPERMFLMRASAKTTTENAYVTGFGASKRLVLWDTIIAHETPDELSVTFGHEMGHYVLGHLLKGMLFSFVVTLVCFALGFYLFQALLARMGKPWRVPAQDNWAALVLMLLVFVSLSFLTEPIDNAFSRSEEHAADVFGQEAVHGLVKDPQAAAQASFQALGENTLDDPHPARLVEFWTYSHPSIAERAAFARYYDPWAAGAEPKYFKK